MKCLYCQASSVDPSLKGYDMDLKTAKKTVDFIFQSPAKSITIEFQGGEPLLNFDVVKYIVEYAGTLNKKHKKDLKFSLVSNLNAIDTKKLDYLVKNNIGLCTSLDGPKFIHDFNRPLLGNSGSYDSVVKWIKIGNDAYKKNNSSVNALITVTKKAIDYPKAIVDEYIKNGFDMIHLRPTTNLGCASGTWEKIGYTPEQFIEFWKKAMDYIIGLNSKGVDIKERMATIMLRKLVNHYKNEDYVDLRSPCGAAIGQLLYNYDGRIFTCDEGRMVGNDIFKIGTVDEKYKDVLTSKHVCGIISASVNDCDICDSCVYKPYCGICPVCNYFEQGSIIAKIPSTPRCKIYMAMFDYLVDKYFFDDKAKSIFDGWVFGKTNKKV
jgi:His-Xaa-Ser system radical SAM maturase HxsB